MPLDERLIPRGPSPKAGLERQTKTLKDNLITCVKCVITLRENGITTPIRRARREIFRIRVGIGVHSLSPTCLSFYIIPKDFY